MRPCPLIIGESHAFYLANAYGELGVFDEVAQTEAVTPLQVLQQGDMVAEMFPVFSRTPFFANNSSEMWIDEKVAPALAHAKEKWSYGLISLEGNIHNAHFMLAGDRPFDFLDPDFAYEFAPNRQIVPRSAVSSFFERALVNLTPKLQLLKAALPGLDLYFVAPPPPIPSEEHIRNFPEIFNFEHSELNQALIRLKIYKVYVATLAACCARQNVSFLRPPPECVDERGFLREAFWNHCTHARPDYYRFITTERFLDAS